MRRRVAREREPEREVAGDEAPEDRPRHASGCQDEAEHPYCERRDREHDLRLRGPQEERDHLPPPPPELRSQDEIRGQTIRRRVRVDEVRCVPADGHVGERQARSKADEEREAPGAGLGSQPLLRHGEPDEHCRHDEECDAGLDRRRNGRRTRGDEESVTRWLLPVPDDGEHGREQARDHERVGHELPAVPRRIRPDEIQGDRRQEPGRVRDPPRDESENRGADDPRDGREEPREPDPLTVGGAVEAGCGDLEQGRLERLEDGVDLVEHALLPDGQSLAVAEIPASSEQRALVLALLDGWRVEAGQPQQQAGEQQNRDRQHHPPAAQEGSSLEKVADTRSIFGNVGQVLVDGSRSVGHGRRLRRRRRQS